MPIYKITYNPNKPWGAVCLPGSKSIAARALICRYVQGLSTEFVNLPDCDDTLELKNALDALEECCPDALARIREFGELPPVNMSFNLGNGGTSLRFFLALAASLPGLCAEIDCTDSLRKRPLAPLIDALRSHGAEITCLGQEGYAPVVVHGRRLRGGKARVDGGISSQFLSAMMLASPLWDAPLDDNVDNVVSRPYVDMTRKVMEQFKSRPARYVVEADWSAASYMYELALAQPGRQLEIASLTDVSRSLQGDAMCQKFFEWAGVRTERMDDDPHGAVRLVADPETVGKMKELGVPVDFDLSRTPDLVPALSAGMCIAGLPFEFGNIGHLRHKECDRLTALATELPKAGYAVRDEADALIWNGGRCPVADDETFEAWGDHRMAMALSIMAVRMLYVAIRGGEVVSKSFPNFYNEMAKVGFGVTVYGK